MKKNLIILTAVAVALLSCAKELEIQEEQNEKVSADIKTFTISAIHEQDASDADAELKTILNTSDGSVTWAAGDVIRAVYDGGSAVSDPLSEGGASARFTVGAPSIDFIVYPDVTASVSGGNLQVTIPSTQDGTFASSAIEVAPYSGGDNVELKNLGALLQIKTAADIDEIILYSNNDTPLTGVATVEFDASGIPSISAVSSGSTSLTLTGLDGSGVYYAAIIPGSFEAGVYIELYSNGTLVGEKLTGNTLTAARRQVRKLGTIASTVIANKVFVTEAGAGGKTGANWDNALDAAGFYSKVTAASTGLNIFMAEGTYPTSATSGTTVSASTRTLTVYGGYPTGLSGTSLSGRNIATHPTVLSGGSANRILVFNGANLTGAFDGLEFRNATTSADKGSAIVIQACKNLKFYNCTVSGNSHTGTATTMGGGAVRAFKGEMLFKGCTFDSNTATYGGGVVRVGGSTTTPDVTFEDCTFSNNTAKLGGAIYHDAGTLTVKGCTFNNNESTYNTTSSPGGGGALYVAKGSVNIGVGTVFHDNNAAFEGGAVAIVPEEALTVSISDTEFYRNRAASATYAGGALYAGGNEASVIDITDCSFYENMAHTTALDIDYSQGKQITTDIIDDSVQSTGGAVYIGKNATIKCDRSLFYHNVAARKGGAIRLNDATAVLYLNRCKIFDNFSGQDASALHINNGKAAVYNCVVYKNTTKTASSGYAANVYFAGESLMANTSVQMYGAYRAVSFYGTSASVVVNNYIVNSQSNRDALTVRNNSVAYSYGHNLYTKAVTLGDTNATFDQTNALADSDQVIEQTDKPTWQPSPYYYLTVKTLPTAYYDTANGIDFRATPATVQAAITYYDTQNGTDFGTWLSGLNEGNGRNALQVDIRGYLSPTDKIWPGSYQRGATK